MSEVIDECEVLTVTSSKSRNGTMWRIEVEDLDNGDKLWLGFGKDEPDFGEGSIISIEFEESDDGKFLNAFSDSVEIIDLKEKKSGGRGNSRSGGSRSGKGSSRDSGRGSSRGSKSSRSSRGGDSSRGSKSSGSSRGGSRGGSTARKGGGGSDKDTYWKDKEERDIINSKRIEAQACRNTAVQVITAALGADVLSLGTKKADKYDNLLGHIDELTARFLEQNEQYIEEGLEAFGQEGDGDDDE